VEDRVNGYADQASLLLVVLAAVAVAARHALDGRALAKPHDLLADYPDTRVHLSPSQTPARVGDRTNFAVVLVGATRATHPYVALPVQVAYVVELSSDCATYGPACRRAEWREIGE